VHDRRRADVAVVQSHQQLSGADALMVRHRDFGDKAGDVRRDRRDVAADIGIVGALEETIDGPPIVAVA